MKIFCLHFSDIILVFLYTYTCTSLAYALLFLRPGENLLKGEEPVWDETKFTAYGKWMDGWESRRRRTEGYDWCIIKLNIPGEVHSFEVDTCHFTGNYSPMVSIQACYMSEDMVC